MKKYIYTSNGILNWFSRVAAPILPSQNMLDTTDLSKKFTCINNAGQNYKVSEGFESDPMELTNFMVIRSKEA
jgi:hypothetical protein